MKDALFDTAWGPVALALTVGCLTLLATLMALGKPRSAWLKGRLELYGGGASVAGAEPTDERTSWRPDMDRLYGTTDRMFAGTRLWKNLERMAERAHVGWRPTEILAWSVAASIATGLVVAMLLSSGLLAVLAALAALVTPFAMLSRRGGRRLRAFDEQLPDVLMTMAGALKVGQSFDNSMKAIADDGLAPASEEFGRVLAETRLGRPLDDALVGMADRIDSEDLRFVLMSVTIQRQVGGNLGDLFHSVSDTVRERQQFRRKVHALTAMGRATAGVLLALPFATGALIAVVGDGYMNTLFTTTIGRVLVAVMLVLMVIGTFVIRKIVDIKG
jgi:tight adherence protein B